MRSMQGLLVALLAAAALGADTPDACTDARVRPGDCGVNFAGKCQCGYVCFEGRTSYLVNCSNTGFTDTRVLVHLPPQTQVLIFTGNYINTLQWNVFGTLKDYEDLRVVDMSNNQIRDILGKSYHHVSNVERLILNHNNLIISDEDNHHHPRVFSNFINLKELHLTNAFMDNTPDSLAEDLHDIFVQSNLTKLIKLHLEQNEIVSFKDRRVFCDLPSLMDLHLGQNKLTHVNFDISCLPHLRFLDLERNEITYLSPTDLKVMDSFTARNQSFIVDIKDNPFHCDCKVESLFHWLKETRVQVRDKEKISCESGFPEENKGETLMELRQIQCQQVPEGSHSAVVSVLVSLLAILTVVLVGVLLYLNWAQVFSHVRPIINTVSRKVQYTTIGKNEEPEMEV